MFCHQSVFTFVLIAFAARCAGPSDATSAAAGGREDRHQDQATGQARRKPPMYVAA